MKKALRIILIILIIIVALFGLNFVWNETNIFYSEPQEYPENYDTDIHKLKNRLEAEGKLMHPDAAPIIYDDGNDNAIMFIHGFTGCSHFFRYYADLFREDGYDVFVPLLPGLGTSKSEYKKSYFSQWYKYAKDVYKRYRKDYDKFYIVGLSMGGAITLGLAEEFSGSDEYPITAVGTLAAPVFLNALIQHGAVSHPVFWFARTIAIFIDEAPRDINPIKEDGAHRKIAYDGGFPKQMHSFKMGIKPIHDNLGKITIPVFLTQSKGDKIVPFQNLYYIANNINSEDINIKVFDLREFEHDRHDLSIYDSSRDELYEDLSYFIKTR